MRAPWPTSCASYRNAGARNPASQGFASLLNRRRCAQPGPVALATGARAAQTALPVACRAVTPGTAASDGLAGDGKVTPARHEHGQQDDSGQEENAAHLCARFR